MSPLSLRNIRLLAMFNFCVDFRLYGPVLIIYFAHVTGSYLLATAVLSLTMLSSAAFEIPTGVLSDRFGRVRVVVAGAAASSVAVALYASAHDAAVLALGALAEGLSRALYNGNNDALLYETLAEERREADYAEYSGRVTGMFQLALAISALAGGFVAAWSLRAAVWISVAPQIAATVIAMQMREPTVRGPIQGNTFAHIGTAVPQSA
jgi:MFS family permease